MALASLRLVAAGALCVLLLLIVLSANGGCEARRRRKGHAPRKQSPWRPHRHPSGSPFDVDDEALGSPQQRAHSMLVLQWPESLCASEKRGCKGVVRPYFTLHGLWPTSRQSVHCRADFDPSVLAPMEAVLTQHWPSYFHRTSMSFWEHEYSKHGSCHSATIEAYFSEALALQSQYPLLDILSPSDSAQPLDFFLSALQSRLGVAPMLMCRSNWIQRRVVAPATMERSEDDGYDADDESEDPAPVAREQLLVEVGLCFDVGGALVDCPEKGRIRRCKRNANVLFPVRGTFTKLEPQD